MKGNRLLIIEDDRDLAVLVADELRSISYVVDMAHTGKTGLAALETIEPDVLLLDLGLPEMHGLAILDVVQARHPRCRVCIMTAFTGLDTKLAAFAAGSDDYLVKPFAVAELLARVEVLMHRTKENRKKTLVIGELCIFRGAPVVQCQDKQVQLSPMEHRLLLYLADRPGEVISRSKLLDEVWMGADRYPNTVDVHIESLRKKLKGPLGGGRIRTAYRQGYYFEG